MGYVQFFGFEGPWDIVADIVIVLSSFVLGIAFYVATNGNPFTTIELDPSAWTMQNPTYCYTLEEAQIKYGPEEGVIKGNEFTICGKKVPIKRAEKFTIHGGPELAAAFRKLSLEEQHAVLTGFAKFPDAFMQECLSKHWRGDGTTCNGCKAVRDDAPSAGEDVTRVPAAEFKTCPRCNYGACAECFRDARLGTCFCKDSNFGVPYPPKRLRAFYEKGIW